MQLVGAEIDSFEDGDGDSSSCSPSPPGVPTWPLGPIEAPPLGRRRRCRTQFSDAALWRLESAFLADPYPDVGTREELAHVLSVTEDRIQVWFQNRRSKVKRTLRKGRSPTTPQLSSHPGGGQTTTPCVSKNPLRILTSPGHRDAKSDLAVCTSLGRGIHHTALPTNTPVYVTYPGGTVSSPGYPLHSPSSPQGEIPRTLTNLSNLHGRVVGAGEPLQEGNPGHSPPSSSQPPVSICEVSSTVSRDTPENPCPENRDVANVIRKEVSPTGVSPTGVSSTRVNPMGVGPKGVSHTGTSVHAGFKPRRPWEDTQTHSSSDVTPRYCSFQTSPTTALQVHNPQVLSGPNTVTLGRLYFQTGSGVLNVQPSLHYTPQLPSTYGHSPYSQLVETHYPNHGSHYSQFSHFPLYGGGLVARL